MYNVTDAPSTKYQLLNRHEKAATGAGIALGIKAAITTQVIMRGASAIHRRLKAAAAA
jgi:hypothetical protein